MRFNFLGFLSIFIYFIYFIWHKVFPIHPTLALNLWSSSLGLPTSGITGMHHLYWPRICFYDNSLRINFLLVFTIYVSFHISRSSHCFQSVLILLINRTYLHIRWNKWAVITLSKILARHPTPRPTRPPNFPPLGCIQDPYLKVDLSLTSLQLNEGCCL